MHKLSEQIERKFTDVVDVSEWEIETDSGWVDIVDVKQTIQYQKWIIKMENGLELICADDHIIFDEYYNEIFVKDCIPEVTKIQTKFGVSVVTHVIETTDFDNMYDLGVDSDDHRFYTNDILSHNTITTVGYLLHYLIFNEHKTVGILANRAKTARGILSKLKQSYRQLPKFLQSGVEEWSKGTIILENGCIAFADATSESASRSESISLLVLDEFAFVENHKAEEFMKSVYPTISSGKKSKIFVFSCVTKDSFVFTNNGIKIMNHFIDDSYGDQQGYQIPNYKVHGHSKLMDGCLIYNNGVSPIYRIESASSWLDSTETHKYFAHKDGKYDWFKISELEEGDWVSVRYGMEQWGCNDELEDNSYGWSEITPNIAYLFGLYLSEGNLSEKYKYVDITCGDDVSHVFKSVGLRYYCYDGLHYRLPQRKGEDLIKLFNSVGLLQTRAPQKMIPDRLMEMSRPNIIAMLQGIMDGDGYSRKDKGTIGIGLSSLEMIKQIRMLFVNFGILSMYQTGITPPTKKVKVESVYHRLELNKKFSQVYYDKIGFRFNRKSMNIYHLNHNGRRGDRNDIIPSSKIILIKNNVKGIWKGGITKSKPNDLSRQWLLDRELGDNFPCGVLDENIKWEKIKKKSYIGEEKTYDFSLPDNKSDFFAHSVTYNGFLTHQTPNGMNHFYKLWTDAKEKRSSYIPYEIHWSDVPGRDEEFKKETISNIGEDAWQQEYETDFLGSAGSLINATTMKRMVYQNPIMSEEYTKIYFAPEKDHNYVITVDPSEGLGLDYSTCVVTDVTEIPYQQACVYRNNSIDPHIFPDVVFNLGMRYNEAYVLVEANNIGALVCNILQYTLEYENLIQTATKGRSGQIVSGGFSTDTIVGVKTTPATKRIGCAITKSLIESDQYIVNDFDTIKEFTTFVRHLNTFQAEEGYNDDIAMCIVLFSWLINNQYFKDMMDKNDVRKKLADGSHLRHLEEALTPFGHYENGIIDVVEDDGPSHLQNGAVWGKPF